MRSPSFMIYLRSVIGSIFNYVFASILWKHARLTANAHDGSVMQLPCPLVQWLYSGVVHSYNYVKYIWTWRYASISDILWCYVFCESPGKGKRCVLHAGHKEGTNHMLLLSICSLPLRASNKKASRTPRDTRKDSSIELAMWTVVWFSARSQAVWFGGVGHIERSWSISGALQNAS